MPGNDVACLTSTSLPAWVQEPYAFPFISHLSFLHWGLQGWGCAFVRDAGNMPVTCAASVAWPDLLCFVCRAGPGAGAGCEGGACWAGER